MSAIPFLLFSIECLLLAPPLALPPSWRGIFKIQNAYIIRNKGLIKIFLKFFTRALDKINFL